MTEQQQKVIVAATRWASFQDADSLTDQLRDVHLMTEANNAHHDLLNAVEALG